MTHLMDRAKGLVAQQQVKEGTPILSAAVYLGSLTNPETQVPLHVARVGDTMHITLSNDALLADRSGYGDLVVIGGVYAGVATLADGSSASVLQNGFVIKARTVVRGARP